MLREENEKYEKIQTQKQNKLLEEAKRVYLLMREGGRRDFI